MKSTIVYVEGELLKAFQQQKECARVIDILTAIDLSALSISIEHKHAIFSAESLLKLYLYRRVKKILIYPELITSLKGQAHKLGLTRFPSKRTFNEFVQKKIDKVLLNTIAALIQQMATQHGVILDVELVKHPVEKKRKEVNRYQKELKQATKLLKQLVYPQIDLKLGQNAKFTTRDLLDVLVHVAYSHDFAHNGSTTFKYLHPQRETPHGDTLLHHLRKFESIDQIKTMFARIFDVIFKYAKKDRALQRKRKLDIAIDIHKIPYYGDKNDDYVTSGKHQQGTNYFFSFLTCSIVVAGRRFTVDAIPIHELDSLEYLVDEILQRAKQKVRINRVYLDRGFDRVRVINFLKKHRVKFIMPKIKSERVKAWLDKTEDCRARVIKDFVIGKREQASVNLVLVDDSDGIKRAFITNIEIPEQMAHYLFRWYGKRWGIETGYRNLSMDFRPRTTSKDYHIRLFYFLFSVCLYNLWVLINLVIGVMVHSKIPRKPLVTAKLFVLLLCQFSKDS